MYFLKEKRPEPGVQCPACKRFILKRPFVLAEYNKDGQMTGYYYHASCAANAV
jgi:hypothetical protein